MSISILGLALGVLIVVAVIITVVVTSGGSKDKDH